MNVKSFLLLLFATVLILITSVVLFLSNKDIALLNPKGIVAQQQFDLLKFAVSLSLIVLVPVLLIAFFISWRYREKESGGKTEENKTNTSAVVAIFWLIPIFIISLLALVTWQATHKLDPYKPINSTKEPLTIQVVALKWKWLFIYPEEDIAAVNYVQFPENTPINFRLTADAPMNSFWIPQLGGQIYAMPGMETRLNLMANSIGEFRGSAAEISGPGFAGMRFVAKSSSDSDFLDWVEEVQESQNILTLEEYSKLAEPSENNQVVYYSWQEDLFSTILNKYSSHKTMQH
jgi:cytochrome o ubiquinol oxidase subunit 2